MKTMTRATGTFQVQGWDENPYDTSEDGSKLTRAEVTQGFQGDIEGDGAVQWLMAYRPDGTAHFVGLQRITGTIGERRGAFLVETTGEFDGTVAKGEWTIIEGSGTEGLAGISGRGRFGAPHGSEAEYELDYEGLD
jgi:hypothetical protein